MSDTTSSSGNQLETLQRQWQEFAEAMAKPWQEVAEAFAKPWQDLPRALSGDPEVNLGTVGRDIVDGMVATFEAFMEQQRAVAESVQSALQPAADEARRATEQFVEGLTNMLRPPNRT